MDSRRPAYGMAPAPPHALRNRSRSPARPPMPSRGYDDERRGGSYYSERGPSEEGHAGPSNGGGAARRAKVGSVCDTCRQRKVACSGGTPCHRCQRVGRACTYHGPAVRSPLTRARMTELEDQLSLHNMVWDSLFPSYSLDQLAADYRTGAAGGRDGSAPPAHVEAEILQRARDAFCARWTGGDHAAGRDGVTQSNNGHQSHGLAPPPVHDTLHRPASATATSRRPSYSSLSGPHGEEGSAAAADTRRNSPEGSRREVLDAVVGGRRDTGVGYEWSERDAEDALGAADGLTALSMARSGSVKPGVHDFALEGPMMMQPWDMPGEAAVAAPRQDTAEAHSSRLDGMASLVRPQEGISYLGLSSGAIFLGAIRRLCSEADIPFDALEKESAGMHAPGVGALPSSSRPRPVLAPRTSFPRTASPSGVDSIGGHSFGSPAMSATGSTFGLPPQAEVLPLVESYFAYFHTLTPLVHEPTIKAQILGALPITPGAGSAVLFNMIFAMGAYDLGTTDAADDGSRYYERAREALTRDLLAEGTLSLVQGVAIMANYLQRNNRPNAGYLCLGLAIRMATALGLHSAPTKTHSVLDRETRKRVWWCIATLEAGCSVTFGRPYGLSRAVITSTPLPINCDDEHINVSTKREPTSVQGPTLYTALLVQARLARLTTGIHDAILQSHPTIQQLRRYDKLLAELQDDLPRSIASSGPHERYRLARLVQSWRIRDFRAILYRPVLLAAAWDARRQRNLSVEVQQAIDICRDMASSNLREIADYMQSLLISPGFVARGTEWYTLFFAFQSSLTLLLSAVWEPGHPMASAWRDLIARTAGWFRQLGSLRKVGLASAEVLESIIATAARTPVTSESTKRSDTDMLFDIGMGEEPSSATLDVWRYWMEIVGQDGQQQFNAQPGWDLDAVNFTGGFPMR